MHPSSRLDIGLRIPELLCLSEEVSQNDLSRPLNAGWDEVEGRFREMLAFLAFNNGPGLRFSGPLALGPQAHGPGAWAHGHGGTWACGPRPIWAQGPWAWAQGQHKVISPLYLPKGRCT